VHAFGNIETGIISELKLTENDDWKFFQISGNVPYKLSTSFSD
jgi:hypothetical protein